MGMGGCLIGLVVQTFVMGQIDWRTGNEFQTAALRSPVQVNWYGAGLRSQILSLAESLRVPVWIDRRVDPDRELELKASGVNFEQALWLAAEKHELGIWQGPDFFYIGPPAEAARLPMYWARMQAELSDGQGDASALRRLARKVTLQGERYAQPRERVMEQLERVGWSLAQPEAVPHDVWDAFSMPRLPAWEGVALLVYGFGLRPVVQENDRIGLEGLPSPETDAVEETYSTRKLANAFWEEMQAKHPRLEFTKLDDDAWQVRGTPIDVLQLRRDVAFGNRLASVAGLEKRYTLTTSAPRGSILASVAEQLQVKLVYDPATLDAMKQAVKINLVNGTLEELIDSVLADSGLIHELSDTELIIRTRK